MNNKRVTIYDLAREMNISVSYISKALNNQPSVSARVKEMVKKKAEELKYKHNSYAANLRRGSSRTIGVIVPHINKSFFSEAIAGIEEVCFENNYGLIICQSQDSYIKECKAIDTLIHQNVDCILISISAETQSSAHLQSIKNNNIEIIQFDRYIDTLNSYKVLNNNEEISFNVVKHLIDQGYKKIACLCGPEHLTIFELRKKGYLKALKEAGLAIPANYILNNAFSKEITIELVTVLLKTSEPPDAFFTVADHQALGVLQAAKSLGIRVPEQLGIIGFANEAFTGIITPALSSVDQKSKELGKRAAKLYFETLVKKNDKSVAARKEEIIDAEIIIRESTTRKSTLH
jgi:DNA-binding LacI/PurR family transcriptional regulator